MKEAKMMRGRGVAGWALERRWLVLFVAVAALMALFLPAAVDKVLPGLARERTVWELPEDAVCLYPDRNAEIEGYKVGDNRFIPLKSKRWIGFELQGEAMRSLLIELGEPAVKNIRVEVYTNDKTDDLGEEDTIQAKLLRGESQLVVDLPAGNYDELRLNIKGEVKLNGIYYTDSAFAETQVTLQPGASRIAMIYAACLLFFAAVLFALGRAIFNRRGRVEAGPYIIAALARVWLGNLAGVWYPQGQGYDDGLIFHYSNLASYLAGREVVGRDVMLKELGMPIILNLVNATGIGYAVFLSLLWVLDGVLAARLVRKLEAQRRPRVEFLTFLYVLFQPVALEKWTGTRLYRNALLTPMYLLVFLIALIVLFDLLDGSRAKLREALWCALPLGIAFSLAYLIKEDGIWLLLSIAALCAIMLCVCLYKLVKRQLAGGDAAKAAVAICLPFAILFASVTAVKQVNYNAFGIYATNARTAGEEGKFVTYVYKTESDERSLDVWAPTDAIDKVFEASDTLRQNKALRKAVFNTAWYSGDIEQNPIQGDFLTWVMKDALFDSGTCTTKREAEAYMKQVNLELEEAFRNGTLKADPKFRLTRSMGGISRHELRLVLKDTVTGYKDMLSSGIYEPGAIIQQNDKDDTQYASIMANQDLNTVGTADAVKYRKYEVAVANAIIGVVFRVYDCIQPLLFALGLLASAAAIWHVVRSIIRRTLDVRRFTKSLLVVYFLSLSFVYLFAIAWFCYYLHFEYFSFFFSIGALPLIVLLAITGISLLRDADAFQTRRNG